MNFSNENLFGYDLYRSTRSNLILELEEKIKAKKVSTIICLNTLKLHLGARDEQLDRVFKSATYTIPDGQSCVLAEYFINGNKISAISGAELMVQLIKLSETKGYKIFFLGAPQSLLDKVNQKIENEYPGLVGKVQYQNGYYDVAREQEVIDKIADFAPDFLFVAFGSPRKEKFIIKYKEQLNAKVLMGVGGSYEYFVGDVKLDPLTKKLGLRWFVRMMQDPKRLAKRYMVCNLYFAYALLKELFQQRIKPSFQKSR
jgi:N-acetylglucosaminyldiphosphoundecaprenol N-acetyl-beta-D-mannosaminyltransferase